MGKTALGRVSFLATLGALAIAASQADAAAITNAVADRVGHAPASLPFQWLAGANRQGVDLTLAVPARRGETDRGLASYLAIPSRGLVLPKVHYPNAARPPTAISFHVAGSTGFSPINCVTFARSVSDIDLQGNASGWWTQAANRYHRGSQPELGSILSFRATAGMPLGHVAVVRQVLSSRLIKIDHANWGSGRGRVDLAVPVEDISPNNDWSLVRVQTTATGVFGSQYPTDGFIDNRASALTRSDNSHGRYA